MRSEKYELLRLIEKKNLMKILGQKTCWKTSELLVERPWKMVRMYFD